MDFFSNIGDFFQESAEDAFSNYKSDVISKAVESTGFVLFQEPRKGNQTSQQVSKGDTGSGQDAIVQRPDNSSGLRDGLLGLPVSIGGISTPIMIIGGLILAAFAFKKLR